MTLLTSRLSLGAGPRKVVVKDTIDIAGLPTCAGSELALISRSRLSMVANWSHSLWLTEWLMRQAHAVISCPILESKVLHAPELVEIAL